MDLNKVLDQIAESIAARVIAKIQSEGVVQPRLLTVAQAAVYLGRSEDSVRRLQSGGHVRVTKLDGRVQFDIRDLEKFIDQSKI